MSDIPETNSTGSSAKRSWHLMLIVTGSIVLLIILTICFLPYGFEVLIRRQHEGWTRHQMAEVKAGKTTSISDPAPELLGELAKDRECADKITEVWIGEMTGSRIMDERFRDLKNLPHLRTIHLWYVGDADALLANIKGMATLEELSFYHARVSATGVRYLASFPHLKQLLLYDRVDPTALEVLKNHVGIDKLYFTGRITSEQVAALKTLPNLCDLTLHVELEGSAVLDLHGFPKMTRLDLGDTAATDEALAGLEEMNNLTDLILNDSMVTDAGLVHFRTNRNLKHLSLSGQPNTGAGQYAFARWGRPITDAGLAQLTGLTALEELNLSKTSVSDNGLEYLKGLTRLQKLDLSGTKVTDKGVKSLQQALPNCKINWKPPKKE